MSIAGREYIKKEAVLADTAANLLRCPQTSRSELERELKCQIFLADEISRLYVECVCNLLLGLVELHIREVDLPVL